MEQLTRTHGYWFRDQEHVNSFVLAAGEELPSGVVDNGGDPDGPAWILWNLTREQELLAERHSGRHVFGFTARYNAEAMNQMMDQFLSGEDWNAVGSAGEGFFIAESDAQLSQRTAELMDEDNNLDTLAARVNAF